MHNKPETEKLTLRQEAETMLRNLEERYHTYALFLLADCHSEGDDIVLDGGKSVSEGIDDVVPDGGFRFPMLRQQVAGSEHLSLSDFVHPQHDRIGIFCTTADLGLETDFSHDEYQRMMAQLLADRLAEATAELMHEAVRKTYWGYAPDEQLTMKQLHAEQFVGIRPAVGYPSLPDTSMNFLIDQLLDLSQVGVRLTESGAMKPHASVSGFMIAHPRARYFAIGKIGADQLGDYARRRGLPVEVMRRFLAANL
jgi:cobalamin-dependent methionine synthase I